MHDLKGADFGLCTIQIAYHYVAHKEGWPHASLSHQHPVICPRFASINLTVATRVHTYVLTRVYHRFVESQFGLCGKGDSGHSVKVNDLFTVSTKTPHQNPSRLHLSFGAT